MVLGTAFITDGRLERPAKHRRAAAQSYPLPQQKTLHTVPHCFQAETSTPRLGLSRFSVVRKRLPTFA